MKKFYLTTALLLAGSSIHATDSEISTTTKASNMMKATKNYIKSQEKSYFLKSTVSILALSCFLAQSISLSKKAYKKFKKKGLGEKMAESVKKTLLKQPTWYDYLQWGAMYLVSGFISCLLLLSLKEQHKEVKSIYNNINKKTLNKNKITVINDDDDNDTMDIE